MDVSIIIVNYQSADLVTDCVASIIDKTHGVDYEIIVVDNYSTDQEREKLIFDDEHVKVLFSPENLGFGKANNFGEMYADGKYLFLLNPDTILLNNAVKILKDYIETNSGVGIVGGNLYLTEEKPAPSYCISFDTPLLEKKNASWWRIIGGKAAEKTGISGKRQKHNWFNKSGSALRVGYVFGADMFLSKELFERAGGFDPDFFMYAEEQELSWRITELGYSVYNVPEARIIHLDGGTFKKDHEFNERQFGMRMNGLMTFYFKCFGVDGMNEAYKYRRLRYSRLHKYALLKKRKKSIARLQLMIDILDQQYKTRRKELVGD